MRSAFALRISSGNYIFDFGGQKRLRAFLDPIFMDGGVVEERLVLAGRTPSRSRLRRASS